MTPYLKSISILALSGVMLLGGLTLLYFNGPMTALEFRLYRGGAKLIDMGQTVQLDCGAFQCALMYRFHVDGKTYFGSTVYDASALRGYSLPGQLLGVRYLPSNPRINNLDEMGVRWGEFMARSVIGFLLAILGTAIPTNRLLRMSRPGVV